MASLPWAVCFMASFHVPLPICKILLTFSHAVLLGFFRLSSPFSTKYVHLFWQSPSCLLKKQQQQQQSPPVVTLDFFASHSHSLDLAPLLPRTSSQSTPQFDNAPGFVPLTVETFGSLCNPFMDLAHGSDILVYPAQHYQLPLASVCLRRASRALHLVVRWTLVNPITFSPEFWTGLGQGPD
jgi:hypothetical protein